MTISIATLGLLGNSNGGATGNVGSYVAMGELVADDNHVAIQVSPGLSIERNDDPICLIVEPNKTVVTRDDDLSI